MGSKSSYNPYAHRVVQNPTTNFETFIHLLKGCLGTGILAMPNAFKNSGLLLGTIGTIIMGIICTYGIHVLIRTQYLLCRRLEVPLLTYPQSLKFSLEEGPVWLRWMVPIAAPLVDIFIVIYQFGICCVYVVFVANSIKEVTDFYWTEIDVRIIMVTIIIPFILITMIRSLRLLSPFSTFANIITFLGLAFILYFIFWPNTPKITSVPLFGKLTNFALFFGTILFALEAIGLVVALENNMATPQSFLGYFGVLNLGMSAVTLLYLLFGFVGYIKYGEESKGSISLNLPQNEILAQAVIIAFAIAIFFSYALQFYVMFEIVWNTWILKVIDDKKSVMIEYGLRITFVILSVVIGLAVPLLSLFISLFGALCLPILGFTIPGLIEYTALWPARDERGFMFTAIKDFSLIIFGIVSTIVAVIITSMQISQELFKS